MASQPRSGEVFLLYCSPPESLECEWVAASVDVVNDAILNKDEQLSRVSE